MKNKGILVVISGFSGAGKGTIMKRLLEKYPEDYALSVSATTRAPRPGEQNAREYFFVSREEFESLIEQQALIEYAQYVGNYYGTPKKYVEDQLSLGKSVILEIEIQGALKVRGRFPETKFLFVTTPSANVLKERLVGRGTETMEVIEQRLSRAVEESKYMECYDYLVVNDELEKAVDTVHAIIHNECQNELEANEGYRVSSNINFMKEMQSELVSFSKGE